MPVKTVVVRIQIERSVMPNVGKLSPYLSAVDVQGEATIKFVDAGKLVTKEFQGEEKTVLEITVELEDGSTKSWSPNGTSYRKIAEKYGPNTEGWVDKVVKITVVTMSVAGTMRKVLYGEPV